jgi:AcrR family transcriptional regulator
VARTPDLRKRAEIAARTFDILRERGLRGAGMAEIAAALEMKRPTLYWYFKDLGSLFDAVLAEALERASRFVAERVLAAPRHPVDLLEAFLRAIHAFHDASPGFVVAMLQLWAAGAPDDAGRVLEKPRAQGEAWRGIAIGAIESGIAAGEVAPCDAAALVDAVRAMADGLVVRAALEPGFDAGPAIEVVRGRLLEPLRRGRTAPGTGTGTKRVKGKGRKNEEKSERSRTSTSTRTRVRKRR